MPILHPQFLIDADSEPVAVMLPISEYDALVKCSERMERMERVCRGCDKLPEVLETRHPDSEP